MNQKSAPDAGTKVRLNAEAVQKLTLAKRRPDLIGAVGTVEAYNAISGRCGVRWPGIKDVDTLPLSSLEVVEP
jgi:hypothetical protein